MKSRIKIQQGIDKLADAVAVTLGPRGTIQEPITVRHEGSRRWRRV
jgi:chaperonin GroEL (HSP60 family)